MAKISYKINRLINPDLQLGLQNKNAVLTGTSNRIESKSIFKYDPKLTIDLFTNNDVVNKLYVDTAIDNNNKTRNEYFASQYLSAASEGRIVITTKQGNGGEDQTGTKGDAPKIELALGPAYQTSEMDKGDSTTKTFTPTETTQVVSGIKLDKYGTIKEVLYKTVSAKDLGDSGTYDNYHQWTIKLNNNDKAYKNILSSAKIAKDGTISNDLTQALNIVFSKGLKGSFDTAKDNTLNIETELDENALVVDTTNKITLKDILAKEKFDANAFKLYFTKLDKYGRIIDTENVDQQKLIDYKFINLHTTAEDGLVAHKTDLNSKGSASAADTYFYTSDASWVKIPFNKIDVASLSTINNDPEVEYGILAAAEDKPNTTANKIDGVSVNNKGTVKAIKFSGNGSLLTDLQADQIVGEKKLSDTVLSDNVQKLIASNLGTIATESVAGQVITTNGRGSYSVVNNPLEGPEGKLIHDFVLSKKKNGTSDGNAEWVSIDSIISDIISGSDGMRFIGVVNSIADIISKAPKSAIKKGDVYKIGADNVDFSSTQSLDIGDTIYAINDLASVSDLNEGNFDTYFASVQNNLDNPAIVGNETITTGHLVAKQDKGIGTNIIYDSIDFGTDGIHSDITGNAATATRLNSSVTLWGQTFNGSTNITGNLLNVGSITPSSDGTQNIGSTTKKFNEIWATTFKGSLAGTAETAKKVENTLEFQNYNGKTITYNGAKTPGDNPNTIIDLSANNLGYATTVTAKTSGTGNAITGIGYVKGDNGEITATASKDYFVKNITSSPFNIEVSNGAATVSFFNSVPDYGTFYTGTALPASTAEAKYRLNLNGLFVANNVKVVSTETGHTSELVSLAQKRKEKLSSGADTHELLVADTTDNNTEYGFIKSGVKITNEWPSGNTESSTTLIPSVSAVSKKVENVQKEITEGSIKCLHFKVTGAQANVTPADFLFASGTVIEHIDLRIKTSFSNSSLGGISIKLGETDEIIAADENTLDSPNDLFTYKIAKQLNATKGITATTASNGASGEADIFVYYANPIEK